MWDIETSAGLARLEHPDIGDSANPVLAVVFHPREDWIATGATDGRIRLWSWKSPETRRFQGPVTFEWTQCAGRRGE